MPTVESMTDEEFKEKIVRSYNQCAAEHKRYKAALEQIADGSYAGPHEFARLIARRALTDD